MTKYVCDIASVLVINSHHETSQESKTKLLIEVRY